MDVNDTKEVSLGLCRDNRRLRDATIRMVDSSAGHDCERQSTGVGRISNLEP